VSLFRKTKVKETIRFDHKITILPNGTFRLSVIGRSGDGFHLEFPLEYKLLPGASDVDPSVGISGAQIFEILHRLGSEGFWPEMEKMAVRAKI
jgi:hypothetical protein